MLHFDNKQYLFYYINPVRYFYLLVYKIRLSVPEKVMTARQQKTNPEK